jgi:7,8-dihydropterin-6-yl-methyl-4-(beta-D-ribofuranosyl)aminobenzene 5'-phosphate synthase
MRIPMTPENIHLRQADHLAITVLVDNHADALVTPSGGPDRHRFSSTTAPLLAEHGLSCLITVQAGDETHKIMMDAGFSAICLMQNAESLGIDWSEIEEVALSHGHFDHFGGVYAALQRIGTQTPLSLHPDAFLERRKNDPVKGPDPMPRLDREALEEAGADIRTATGPTPLADGLVLMTGEVPRTTTFERGSPSSEARIDGTWQPDPFRDDQGLVVDLKGRGLVVISGCAHAGIINTVRYAEHLAGTEQVHAVIGGFHLSGPAGDPRIEPTVRAMQQIDPTYLVPLHCTGWNALRAFADTMPDRFILNTVGTTYLFP